MSSIPRPLCKEETASYCKFGADYLLKLITTFEEQIAGVIKSEDTEYVHRMRVTSRRIRATLPIFRNCFPKKKYKKWLKAIKQVTRLLGEARDLDVQIALIDGFQSEYTPPPDSAVTRFIENHKSRRTEIQPNVSISLESLRDSGILEEMREFFFNTSIELKDVIIDPNCVLERAYWNIAYRLDDFLEMERYVHKENKIAKHHEMRIRAKWLRYTMETFSLLYDNKLAQEIDTMKRFQDLLGEMHDCDVLKAQIQTLIRKRRKEVVETTNDRSLEGFWEYLNRRKSDHYVTFVDLFDSCKKSGFFGKLHETTGIGILETEDILNGCQSQAQLGIISDIHGNIHALKAVIEDAKRRGVNFFLNAGDLIGFGPYPNEVIEFLRLKNVVSVIGNFDLEVFQNHGNPKKKTNINLQFTRKQVSGPCRAYLQSLPRSIELEIAGKRLFMTHGTPKSINEHVYSNTPVNKLRIIAKQTRADVVILGHSHEQFFREVSDVFFLDPGSVGRPGDGNPQTAYAVMRLDPLSFELIRIDYEVADAAKALRKKKLPENYSQMLLQGVSLESIAEEDRARKVAMSNSCKKTVNSCRQLSKRYWPDDEHYEQVRKLSLKIFDQLKLPKYGNVERCWLECASILHDIGLSRNAKDHHLKTMELILNDSRLPFSSEDRRIIASIARYHRKTFPKKKHYNLASMNSNTIRKITVLSGILRIADSLDYGHNRTVNDLELQIGSKRIIVACTSREDIQFEREAFIKKRNLIEKALKKKMVLTCSQC